MASFWRAHFTFNKYSQIAAQALRNSLKESERVAAERRGLTALKYQKWENGKGGEQTWVNRPETSAGH
ncbi:mitochondrial ATP synthase epsilon chain-domain-containing protein [Cantharellus anzutake]|uniref:mitochondrial ATP synthase epsilon chain-domain-containing protein n=1 Tax=Cantharellus anzutake TaxID=1750568 RepID=UPI001905AF69|nr:mitochondrial ATP synthase epsilon chain-domain-containing protein [Cantharellus anzutake]KAF8329844.1 mitochondrial ATP synthase epsilon chain-domain-containing protein [Cantharellus anzutake]